MVTLACSCLKPCNNNIFISLKIGLYIACGLFQIFCFVSGIVKICGSLGLKKTSLVRFFWYLSILSVPDPQLVVNPRSGKMSHAGILWAIPCRLRV